MIYEQKVAGCVVNWKQPTLDVTWERLGYISAIPSWISIATTTLSRFTAHAMLATFLVIVALCEA